MQEYVCPAFAVPDGVHPRPHFVSRLCFLLFTSPSPPPLFKMAGSQTTLNNNEQKMEKDQYQQKEDASIQKAELPSGSRLNAAGIPTFMGLTGHPLIWAITVASSFGFGLFGSLAAFRWRRCELWRGTDC